jgi:hypothetical protein
VLCVNGRRSWRLFILLSFHSYHHRRMMRDTARTRGMQ